MSYCQNAKKATVNYSFNNINKTIIIEAPPIDITTSGRKENSSKCWRFSGQGRYNDFFYDFFACGINPSWHDNGDFLQPYIDGGFPFGSIFGVRYGSGSVTAVADDTDRKNSIRLGDCSACNTNVCTIVISKNGNTIFTDKGECPCSFNVACDDKCPDGYAKCISDNYPGYCCLPCSSTSSRIDSLTQMVKSIVG